MSVAAPAIPAAAVTQDHPKENDIEKSVNPTSQETSSNDGIKEDRESERFQPGVQRVRAITEIWSKQTMIAMFVL